MSNKKFFKVQSDKNNFRKNVEKQRNQRRNFQHLLNKSFITGEKSDQKPQNYVSLDDAASKIHKAQFERTSSPDNVLCEHCEHDHAKECCLYIYDDLSDIARYSLFKKELDEPYTRQVMNNSEDYDMQVGDVTPSFFPGFTDNNPDRADRRMLSNYRKPPTVYFRQYVWPVFLPTTHQIPTQNINQYRNPYDIKYQAPQLYGNYFQHNHIPHPYFPPVMRQVALSFMESSNIGSHSGLQQPQIIESHSYLPINHCGGWW